MQNQKKFTRTVSLLIMKDFLDPNKSINESNKPELKGKDWKSTVYSTRRSTRVALYKHLKSKGWHFSSPPIDVQTNEYWKLEKTNTGKHITLTLSVNKDLTLVPVPIAATLTTENRPGFEMNDPFSFEEKDAFSFDAPAMDKPEDWNIDIFKKD